MKATCLELKNFRNIENAALFFDSGMNIIYGQNAQGKTNVIEALWLFSVAKSFRAAREREIITHGMPQSEQRLLFENEVRQNEIKINIARGERKKIFKNGVKIAKTRELIGNFYSVLFCPEHLSLVKDGPGERRRFLDMALCQLKPRYMALLEEYNRLLLQKNSLLKDRAGKSLDTLDIWNEKLSAAGAQIALQRLEYVGLLQKYAENVLYELSGGAENITIDYIFCGEALKEPRDLKSELLSLFDRNRQRELKEGVCLFGPHRDDLEIKINGFSARLFASQGQQRSCVLALKAAEADILYTQTGEAPVMLLDDVLSELDGVRQKFLIQKIIKKQVIITCCEPEHNLKGLEAKLFYVKSGRIN